MNFYKLIISYDGTDFSGWQSQKIGPTVQTCIKNTFKRAFGKECFLFAASRTDTGVHAQGQVARLRTDVVGLEPEKIKHIFNNALPASIRIEELESADVTFSPHHNIDYKIYQYKIFTQKPSPVDARFGWWPPAFEKTDWEKFEKNLTVFEGEHNFLAFCRLEQGEEKQVVRTIQKVSFSKIGDMAFLIEIKAHSFLRYQIRRMIGAAFEVARKKAFDKSILEYSLRTGISLPSQISFNAPPSGLCLKKIVYKI